MKKLAIATGLLVLSTGALASKARLEALGESANGSQFLDDNRNVFLNPAHLNSHYDWVTMEWGSTDTGVAQDQDTSQQPKAEGGIFKNAGNMIYGLYFGSESNTSNALRAAAGVNIEEQNNLDFFVGGDAGVQWGARLTYHSYENEQGGAEDKSSAQRLALGVVSGNVDAFLNFGLANTAEDGTNEFTGNGSIDLGVTYAMGDMDYMLRYQSIGAEREDGNEYKVQNTWVGVAKSYKLNDKAQAWASAWYKMDTQEDFSEEEEKNTYLPVSIGVEVMAKDWLQFRGSVTHEVIGTEEDNDGDKATRGNTTSVNAGASLVYGDFQIDGLIGNSTDGNNATGQSTDNGNGNLRTDNIMSRVSMTYKF